MSNISFAQLNARLGEVVDQIETSFQDELESFDPQTASSADLIQLQAGMQKWTIATNLQTNTLKTVGEGLKSTVQNIR